jgi:hypothetical protein
MSRRKELQAQKRREAEWGPTLGKMSRREEHELLARRYANYAARTSLMRERLLGRGLKRFGPATYRTPQGKYLPTPAWAEAQDVPFMKRLGKIWVDHRYTEESYKHWMASGRSDDEWNDMVNSEFDRLRRKQTAHGRTR